MDGDNRDKGLGLMMPAERRSQILHGLVPVASHTTKIQLESFVARLTEALFAASEDCTDTAQARLHIDCANALKKNGNFLVTFASAKFDKSLRHEMAVLDKAPVAATARKDDELELVSYSEMDNRMLLSKAARPFELKHTDQLQSLATRLTSLLGRDELTMQQNPFRPEIFMSALNEGWTEFNQDAEAHPLLLALLQRQPDLFIDLGPVLHDLNQALIVKGILPSLTDSYRIKKSGDGVNKKSTEEINAELRRRLMGDGNGGGGGGGSGGGGGEVGGDPSQLQNQVMQLAAANQQLMGFLAGMQKNMFDAGSIVNSNPLSTEVLSSIKQQAPQGSLNRVDENAIDLLSQIFEMVFHDQHIPKEMKALIGFLQVPILKAALIDKDFFFKQEHPARKLVETLTQSSMGWDQEKGQDDPLYQNMKRAVDRVQKDFDQEVSVFSDVTSEFDHYLKQEEQSASQTLAAPISSALKAEKINLARKSAKNEVALRIGTGEVVAFVEAFLENKWVSVLTIAYSLQDEKPEVVESAVTTMDDLIWSVQPKISKEERKEFLARLPSILARLNKWLNVVQWEDEDRKQFFADLAETHASIVRSPLPISPARQVELSIEVAKKAAERRLEKQAQAQAQAAQETGPDEFDEKLKEFKRGAWFNFTPKEGEPRRAKLSWVSPMHSLFIFTTNKKEETFQLTDAQFAQKFRDGEAQEVVVDGLVERALAEAFASANDPKGAQKRAA